ncbi:radical SAM protein [candidate division WOR-3 bacterium RBG_13_43_14]|uniref:Radical SAM protein n=1 Tax=candidate division WOR-3 bacterium RBG_13_43_14 TaxID=1802590 RepID=A0A1F4U2R8_UNCW3|nr:MAG: radical SAM protein [candidate division WOR-3 bacterium RBG_13_43_14]
MNENLKIIKKYGKEDLAYVYLAEFGRNKYIEFVESLQPPIPREKKWVLIISSSFGCPIKCRICDAGGQYNGNLNMQQILAQIDFMVLRRYPDRNIPCEKFKIQFARMGEPSLNHAVLKTLNIIPDRYEASGLMPCISTVAPRQSVDFFEELIDIKNRLYPGGNFQMQFSIHSTNEELRDELIPIPKLTINEIAIYGLRFVKEQDRKITLNFALARGFELNARKMSDIFSVDHFMIKITPLNPTYKVVENKFDSYISAADLDKHYEIVEELRQYGFETLISIGENEENLIGSNCGQYIARHLETKFKSENSYTYIK